MRLQLLAVHGFDREPYASSGGGPQAIALEHPFDETAARVFGLEFVPLIAKRYDLVVRKSHLKLPQIEGLVETLGRASFRRAMEAFAGYDMKSAGDRVM